MTATDLNDPIDVKRTGKPNDALVCPPDVCAGTSDVASPNFALPREELEQIWLEVVLATPRTEQLGHDPGRHLYLFRQRSAVFGFIDLISVRFLTAEGGHSTLAAYSRSQTGYYDFGVNRRRLQTWLKEVTARAVAKQVPEGEDSATERARRS